MIDQQLHCHRLKQLIILLSLLYYLFNPLFKIKNMNKMPSKPYSRHQEFNMIMPTQFLLLCRLLQVPPQKVLFQFACNLGHESFANNEKAKITSKDYFLTCGYGQNLYTDAEIELMFEQLDAVSSLWPKDGPMKLIDLHSKWRDKYQRYLFKKWYKMIRPRH